MGCGCHGKDGRKAASTKPYDQCTACARKHVKAAWSKWGEFTYEDANRDYVSAQLRDAADHLKYDHPEDAQECRAAAIAIEENLATNAEMMERLEGLRRRTLELFYQDNPGARQRLEEMRDGD